MTPERQPKPLTKREMLKKLGEETQGLGETAEEWGLSYWFGIEMAQEQIDKQRNKEEKEEND